MPNEIRFTIPDPNTQDLSERMNNLVATFLKTGGSMKHWKEAILEMNEKRVPRDGDQLLLDLGD